MADIKIHGCRKGNRLLTKILNFCVEQQIKEGYLHEPVDKIPSLLLISDFLFWKKCGKTGLQQKKAQREEYFGFKAILGAYLTVTHSSVFSFCSGWRYIIFMYNANRLQQYHISKRLYKNKGSRDHPKCAHPWQPWEMHSWRTALSPSHPGPMV